VGPAPEDRSPDPNGDRDPDPDDHRSQARVREVYDRIATHFSKTRASPWPEVEAFLEGITVGGCGLDVGCGNGRHLELLSGRTDRAMGVDASREVLSEAREAVAGSGATLVQGDAARLPLASGTVDVALYVATLHHLPDRETRRRSLDELARVLAPGARGLVSVWATTHDRFEGADGEQERGFDTTVDWTLVGGETVPRFYHIYAPAEFRADLAASALDVDRTAVSSGNCYGWVRG
jgi:ubiquinone/menaquinone biosynthesis C-methylase UbiE